MPWTTRDLRRAQNAGAVIRVFSPEDEHHGKQVSYDPERPGDRTPWRLVRGETRFPAAECRAEGLHGGPWAVASLLRF